MRNIRAFRLAGMLLLAAVGTSACSSPPPPGAVYVERQPPRDRIEVVGAAPGPNVVWMRGFWRWDGAQYTWVPGHYVAIERGYREWAPGHWRHGRRGWYFVDGHWR